MAEDEDQLPQGAEADLIAAVAQAEQGDPALQRSDLAFSALLHEVVVEIDRQMAVFLGSEQDSGPHKTRVALRRLTTALDAFAPILKRKAAGRARAEAKWIFRRLGRVRDADVYLAGRRKRGAPAAEIEALARDTLALRAEMREALRLKKAVAFAPALLRDLSEGLLLKTGQRGLAARARPVSRLAARALDAAWAAGLSHGKDIAGLSEEARHEFRKDMKTLRYTAEFFEPLWPVDRWAEFEAALEDLQDALGLLNDLAVARRKAGKKAPARATDRGDEAQALEAAEALWRRLLQAGPFWTSGG
ncbi:CHAD domain-containing protein [Xinfangfangia pollutisoli]|uniref:CHAD domain-containing protein n=1 Tax=Xinfangfangia pollutisoli TaxID=2865960 RepID=UPI001CD28919|nr:CHAD domain-containing protein [Xinfangfangia pollutisoli]